MSWYGHGRCRNAAPHVGTCVVVPSSWTHDTPIFRTKEAQENQPGSFRAQIVIFAHIGPVMRELREGQYVSVPRPCWRADATTLHAGKDTVTGAEPSHLVWHTPEVDPPRVCGCGALDARIG